MAKHSSAAAARVQWPARHPRSDRRLRRQQQARAVRPRAVVRFVTTVVLVAGILLILGVRQAGITALGYQIDATKRDLAAARAELAALEAELARLAAPDRVEQGALALGMTGAADVRLAQLHALAPQTARTEEGRTVVVKLPPAREDGAAAAVAVDPRGLTERVSDLVYSWLSGGRVEAETLH